VGENLDGLFFSVLRKGDQSNARLVFFQAQGRADLLVRFTDEVGFCLVPEDELIFDSVVADLLPTPKPWRPSVFGQIRGRIEAKSANIELCVICRSSLNSKI